MVAIALYCSAQASDGLSELPVGHLKITQGVGGNINVQARCVPTKELLETLAGRMGMPIVFEKPCHTYVSIWFPHKQSPPEQWMDFIAGFGGETNCVNKDGVWRVYSLALSPRYDCSLTEGHIRQRFRGRKIHPPRPPASGVFGGLLLLKGRFIPGPYQIKYTVGTNSACYVTVNGLEVRSIPPPPPPRDMSTVPDLPESGQFTDRESLRMYIIFRLYRNLLTESTPREALAQVAEFLDGQDIVERVLNHAFPVYVQFKHAKPGSSIFPVNYDPETGQVISRSGPSGPAATEQVERYVHSLEERLSTPTVLVRSGGVQVGFASPQVIMRFAEVISVAKHLPLLQAECLLAEIVEDRALSRELAANLGPDYAALEAALAAMLGPHESESADPR